MKSSFAVQVIYDPRWVTESAENKTFPTEIERNNEKAFCVMLHITYDWIILFMSRMRLFGLIHVEERNGRL